MNKEQTKKIILGAFCLIGLLYVYFAFFLGPLHKGEAAMNGEIDDLQQKIASSKGEIAKADRLEESARAATSHYDALRALTPDGAPIAWFPPKIRNFFNEQHIDKATVRLDTTTPSKEKELSNWSRYVWSVDLPQADFATLGQAICALENSEPLLAIKKLTIRASTESPQLQQVTLTLSTLIDKK
ncbi:MAG: hypothetical protein ACR2FX_09785 [Chthoniobacterales bacterium]